MHDADDRRSWNRSQAGPGPVRRRALMATAAALAVRPVAGQTPRKWPYEQRCGRFVVHADFDWTHALPVTTVLEEIDRDVQATLRLPPSENPIHVVVMKSESAYRRYMETYFPKLPFRRALFLRDRGPGMLFTYQHPAVLDDIRHEVTHAVVNDDRPPLPLWIDEGIAEYFEPPSADRYAGNPYLAVVQEELNHRSLIPLETLEAIEDLATFGDEHYRHSWAWVHFLLHRTPRSRELLVEYVRSFFAARDFRLSQAVNALFPDVALEVQQHFAALPHRPSTDG
ncbi:MAG: hypothetical protein D6753_12050 [Planctomycetota bacterium]|nr:MAG: hypothetical protein D6753_12050 [Planctomycetota bacterium]